MYGWLFSNPSPFLTINSITKKLTLTIIESLVLKSSLALAGIHPVKRRVAAAAAVAASAWPLPAPRCKPAAANGVASWAGLYPGKNLAAAPPRAATDTRCRRYRHYTPTWCRRAAVLLSCLHCCCCARAARAVL